MIVEKRSPVNIRPWLCLVFLLPALLALVACGTLQVDIEPELEEAGQELDNALPTSGPIEPVITKIAIPTGTSPGEGEGDAEALGVETAEAIDQEITATDAAGTGTEQAETDPASPLKVAYVKNENVFLWTEADGSKQLTGQARVEGVRLSHDGQWVAFWRNQNLWVVKSDGTDERNLTTQRDFASLEISDELAPFVQSIVPYQVAWRPGTHDLYFNTVPQLDMPGLMPNDDLWLVDVISGQLTPLLPPGEGGNFYFSPDGKQLAVVTPGRIDLMDPDGDNRREALSHTPVITYSEVEYYARPMWAADSSVFMVAIPPADLQAGDHQPTSIWQKGIDETPARLIGNLTSLSALQAPPTFSPDLNYVAYLFGDAPTSSSPGMAIAQIGPDGLGESTVYSQQVDILGEWSADGFHFLYTPGGFNVPLRTMATLGGEPLVIGDGQSAISSADWAGETHILFVQNNGAGWDILLTQPGGQPVFVDSVEGPPPATDISGSP